MSTINRLVHLMRSAERQPDIGEDGVPRCSTNDCCKYDGKRCRDLGQRPDGICEPAVLLLIEALGEGAP